MLEAIVALLRQMGRQLEFSLLGLAAGCVL